MSAELFSAPAASDVESFYKFTDDCTDPVKFEAWKPKIEAYRKALKDAMIPEYLIPESELPTDLDLKPFNSVKFLKESSYLSDAEKKITGSTATELAAAIADKTYSSVEVLKAFTHRAMMLHQLTNFANEFFFDEALAKAQELDEYLAKTGKTVGPLHGIPVSLKEQIGFNGKITHGGWVGMLDNYSSPDSCAITMMRKLGAVLYVRTNQPQSLMHLDSNNNIVGRTRNPYNSLLTAGGSSGGEGASVGGFGSPIGIGTDIGGSIRGPAAFSGVWGLRPSTRRIGNSGVSSGTGQESIPAVAGPLARSIDDIELFMKSYINVGQPWDVDIWSIPVIWRDVATPKPEDLTIAILYDDGNVRPHAPITRGLKHVAEKLTKAGVNVIEFEPIHTKEMYEDINVLFSCDGNHAQKELIRLSGEKLMPLTKWAMSFGKGDEALSITENRQYNYRRDCYRKEYLDYMVKNKVDFIISPTYVGVSPVCANDGIAGPYYWGYTTMWNILDMPTLVFPTGLQQDPKVDIAEPFTPRSKLEEMEHSKYKPEYYVDAPICLQLTARRYHDEEAVACGKLLKEILELPY